MMRLFKHAYAYPCRMGEENVCWSQGPGRHELRAHMESWLSSPSAWVIPGMEAKLRGAQAGLATKLLQCYGSAPLHVYNYSATTEALATRMTEVSPRFLQYTIAALKGAAEEGKQALLAGSKWKFQLSHL